MCTKFLMSNFFDTYLAPLSFGSQLYTDLLHTEITLHCFTSLHTALK